MDSRSNDVGSNAKSIRLQVPAGWFLSAVLQVRNLRQHPASSMPLSILDLPEEIHHWSSVTRISIYQYIRLRTPRRFVMLSTNMPETFLACCALAYCRVHLRVYFNQYSLLTGTLFPCPEYASNTRVFTYCQPL